MLSWQPLSVGGACVMATPPTCTSIQTSGLDWQLHGLHTYYITVKVTNTAGLTTMVVSDPYIHDVQVPSHGVVIDISTEVS